MKLQALEVRQERLHQIDRASAIAEGMHSARAVRSLWPGDDFEPSAFNAVRLFSLAWCKINGLSSWDRSNPWVWVLRFKVLAPLCGRHDPRDPKREAFCMKAKDHAGLCQDQDGWTWMK